MERTLVGILLLLILVLIQGAMAAETYGYVTQWGGLGVGDGQFDQPCSVAIDSSHNVYVVDPGNDRIEKFTPDGKTLLAKWGSQGSGDGQFNEPRGVAVDSSDNIFVVDQFNNRIEKFTPDGKTLLAKWGSPGSGDGQFGNPYGIAVDSSGNVYVADSENNRIQKFTSDGKTLLAKWGSLGSGDGQFYLPRGVAVDSSGNVYVEDTGNNRIEKFTSDGTTLLAKWGSEGSGDGQFESPWGVAVDSSENVYVSDDGNSRIEKFNSDGTMVLAKWGSEGSGDGQLRIPVGVAVDSSGNVYVADSNNYRIEEFAKPVTTGPSMMFRYNAAHTGDYSQVAGVTGTTVSQLWSYQTGDPVYSSPAVADGVMYVGSNDGNVYAFDSTTGALKWKYPIGLPIASSPAVMDGVVYADAPGYANERVYAIDAVTGQLKWSNQTSGLSDATISSPTVADGVVYVGRDDGPVQAFDAATGVLKWSYGSDYSTGQSSPAVADGIVYFGSGEGKVFALDATTGALKWSYQVAASPGGSQIESSPAVANGIVYIGSRDNNEYALDATTGALKWSFPADGEPESSAAVVDGVVYVGSNGGSVYALDATTGAKKWSYRSPSYAAVLSSPAVANGIVYLGCNDDKVYALDAGTGDLTWSYPTGNRVESSPAVVNGIVYVGSGDGSVYALSTGTPTGSIAVDSNPQGAEIWIDETDMGVHTPATIDNLAEGGYRVNVTLAGYADPGEQVVTVTAGQTTSVIFTLSPIGSTGSITVDSNPQGAEIWVDEIDMGVHTPATIDNLAAGQHNVNVTLAGYPDPGEQVVAVTAGQTASVMFTLIQTPTIGSIAVDSTPPGAEIYLDGADTHSITPATIDSLSTGSHKVKVTLTDYQAPAEKDVTITGGQTSTVTFPLVAVAGDIVITSDPGSAEIWVDGTDTGVATKPVGGTVQWVTLTGISPGIHTVKISLLGYVDATQQVTVTAGSITSAKFQMVPVAATGSIHVTSDPVGSKGSNIFLDGIDTGQFTDATLTGITPGIYTVQAAKYTLPFYIAPKQQVTVTAGLTTDVHFDMRMYGIGSIYVKAGCPVDITVTDPQGHTISSQNNDIPGASYVDLGLGADGRPDSMILIPASDGAGTYLVTVTPKAGALPTDTFTLTAGEAGGKSTVLADKVPISAIPDKPYSFTVSGTSPVPEYPVPAVPALCIAMFALGIIALKIRRD